MTGSEFKYMSPRLHFIQYKKSCHPAISVYKTFVSGTHHPAKTRWSKSNVSVDPSKGYTVLPCGIPAASGGEGGFEADCPAPSCWWYHRLGNSCLIWLVGHQQQRHYSCSETPSCWTVAVAEPPEPENWSVGAADEKGSHVLLLSPDVVRSKNKLLNVLDIIISLSWWTDQSSWSDVQPSRHRSLIFPD